MLPKTASPGRSELSKQPEAESPRGGRPSGSGAEPAKLPANRGGFIVSSPPAPLTVGDSGRQNEVVPFHAEGAPADTVSFFTLFQTTDSNVEADRHAEGCSTVPRLD